MKKKKIKESIPERIFDAINYLFLFALMLVTVYPFWYVFSASVSIPALFVAHRGVVVAPIGFSVDSYRMVFQNPLIISGYINTIVYLAVGTLINMVLTVIGGYVLSRSGCMMRSAMNKFITFTMFFSGGLIPMFLLVKSFGMLDTMWALIIPSAISTYNMIIMRTAFASLPASLEESAKLDGANDIHILFKILMPLTKATMAVLVLFYAVSHWNSWFPAMIYLRDSSKYPLQLVLRDIIIASNQDSMTTEVSGADSAATNEVVKYATIMVATVPILVAYPFLQKYFVKGVMVGAVKG